MELLYGRAGRLTALFGGFRPGQVENIVTRDCGLRKEPSYLGCEGCYCANAVDPVSPVAGFGVHAKVDCPGPPGRLSPLPFFIVNRFCVARSYGRAGRLIANNGGFRPGQL
jgi:hypothetical protein